MRIPGFRKVFAPLGRQSRKGVDEELRSHLEMKAAELERPKTSTPAFESTTSMSAASMSGSTATPPFAPACSTSGCWRAPRTFRG